MWNWGLWGEWVFLVSPGALLDGRSVACCGSTCIAVGPVAGALPRFGFGLGPRWSDFASEVGSDAGLGADTDPAVVGGGIVAGVAVSATG